MKKTKIITISILGLLLLVPFLTPTKAVPASYVGVAETDSYVWGYYQYDWTQFFADDMPGAFEVIFNHDLGSNLTKVYLDWDWTWWFDEPRSNWDLTVDALLPENTTDDITYTPYNLSFGYIAPQWTPVQEYWTDTFNIANDTSSFANASLYGGMATTPYWLQGIPIGPNNINWTEFAIESQLGLESYWGGFAANTTITALPNGYNMSVPISGYENNTLPISIITTYDSDGVLIYNAMSYGSNLIYKYIRADGTTPILTDSPANFIVAPSYTGESLSWTVAEFYPTTYTITQDNIPVVNATAWADGVPVVYNITDGLSLGLHTYVIKFENLYGSTLTHEVNMTVRVPDTTDPVTTSPADIVIEFNDLPPNITWTATDANPGTYTIKRNGTAIVEEVPWVSGSPVTRQVEWGLQYLPGVTTYEITFKDITGNNVSDTVTLTVGPMPPETTPPPRIPGFEPLIVIGIAAIGVIGILAFKKKKK